ncbi:MAG: PorT family protein [Flavobacteriaceae bacterium]|nr:PorT family protein [Flavobacteriaceae bacterium]
MKKILFAAIAVLGFMTTQAQETQFGVKAGYAALSGKAEASGYSATESDGGFFIGGFADVTLSDKFHFQPELLYVSVDNASQVQIPLHAKYMATKALGVKAGPNLAFLTDVPDGIKSFNFGLDLGAEYNFAENFVVDARYNFGLANLSDVDGFDYHLSGFYIGVGYKF